MCISHQLFTSTLSTIIKWLLVAIYAYISASSRVPYCILIEKMNSVEAIPGFTSYELTRDKLVSEQSYF